jgi:hypothetical protein
MPPLKTRKVKNMMPHVSKTNPAALRLSDHAAKRAQQRGIKGKTRQARFDFGTSKIRHGGCEVFFMDKNARDRARRILSQTIFAQLEPAFDACLVLADDGTFLTCAHRTKKLRL